MHKTLSFREEAAKVQAFCIQRPQMQAEIILTIQFQEVWYRQKGDWAFLKI